MALGGPIPIPLPPHEAAPIIFEYDPQRGLMYAQSADLSEEMVMFTAVNEQQALAEELLKMQDGDKAKTSGSGCDWDALPILIGTNYYTSRVLINMCHAIAQWEGKKEPSYKGNCEEIEPFVSPDTELEMEMTLSWCDS